MAPFCQGSATTLKQLAMDLDVAKWPASQYSLLSQGIETDMLSLSPSYLFRSCNALRSNGLVFEHPAASCTTSPELCTLHIML